MQPNLKLVANSFFAPQGEAVAKGGSRERGVTDLLLNCNGANEVKEESAASYKTLVMVLAAHVLIAAGMLRSWADAEISKEPAMTMMVNLVSNPASVSERQLIVPEPKAAKQVIEKQAPAVKQKLATSELPARELAASEPVIKEQLTQAVAAEVSNEPAKLVEQAHKSEAAKEKTEAEPVTEPPRFGAAYLNNPAPAYPPMSRRAGEQGRVVLKVLVSESGVAERVQLETGSGYEKLDQAAIEAVKKWSFIPAKRSNQAVSAYVLVPVKFTLGG